MKKSILVVDDSLSIREVVGEMLEKNNFNVYKAIDGKDALSFLDGREIHIILTDLHMPVMNGLELIKEVRKTKKYKHIPILFLTTETKKERKLEAKNAGATGWLIKPFDGDKLIKTIKRVLR